MRCRSGTGARRRQIARKGALMPAIIRLGPLSLTCSILSKIDIMYHTCQTSVICPTQLSLLTTHIVGTLCCTKWFWRLCRSLTLLCKCWALMGTYPSRWLQSASPHQCMRLWWMTHQLQPGALAQLPHHLSSFPRVLALAALPQRLDSGDCRLPRQYCLFGDQPVIDAMPDLCHPRRNET